MDKHFLKEDTKRADGEKCCIAVLAVSLLNSIEQNNFYEAEKHLRSMLKSTNELKRMQDKAEKQERLREAASHLISIGSTDEAIRRFSHE